MLDLSSISIFCDLLSKASQHCSDPSEWANLTSLHSSLSLEMGSVGATDEAMLQWWNRTSFTTQCYIKKKLHNVKYWWLTLYWHDFCLVRYQLSGLLWLFAGSGIACSGSGNSLLSSSWHELQGTWSVWLIQKKCEHTIHVQSSTAQRSRNAQISHSVTSLFPCFVSHCLTHLESETNGNKSGYKRTENGDEEQKQFPQIKEQGNGHGYSIQVSSLHTLACVHHLFYTISQLVTNHHPELQDRRPRTSLGFATTQLLYWHGQTDGRNAWAPLQKLGTEDKYKPLTVLTWQKTNSNYNVVLA